MDKNGTVEDLLNEAKKEVCKTKLFLAKELIYSVLCSLDHVG